MKQKPGMFQTVREAFVTLATWLAIAILVIVFGALVGLGVMNALAQSCEAELTWTPPTLNTDGTALEDLAGFRVYYGTTETALDNSIEIPEPGATMYAVLELEAPETWYFAATAYNASNVESEHSNIASKTCAPVPAAPSATDITVTFEVVYQYLAQTDRAVMLPVGTIAQGAACSENELVVAAGVAYFGVPRDSVVWYGTVRPAAVYARCE